MLVIINYLIPIIYDLIQIIIFFLFLFNSKFQKIQIYLHR
jgi:hypothetical protein